MAEKKIFRYVLDMGFERVEIPVRVKFEFEVLEGSFVPGTLTKKVLYNRDAIEKNYPEMRLSSLDSAIEEMVEHEIMEYLKQCKLFADRRQEAT